MGRVLQAEYLVDNAHDVPWICPVDAAASKSGNQTTEKCSSWRCRVAERCVNNNEQQRAYAHGSAEVGSHCAKQGGCHARWKMLSPCIVPHHQRQQYPNIASLCRVQQPLWVNVSIRNFNPHLCLPASRACAWVCV